MPDTESIVPIFQGEFRFGLDESRRIMIPAKWRPKDQKMVFTAVLWPIEAPECLLVLPPEGWQRILTLLKPQALSDKRVAVLERVIGGTSTALLLDKVGRFCLPDHLATSIGLEKEAMFVGRLEKFEIWNPNRYQAARPEDKAVAAQLAVELKI